MHCPRIRNCKSFWAVPLANLLHGRINEAKDLMWGIILTPVTGLSTWKLCGWAITEGDEPPMPEHV